MPEPNETLLTEINTRLAALGESVSEQRLIALIKQSLPTLMEQDKEFARKMRFAAPDAPLVGSKYARWGLTIQDIEWLYDVQMALRGQPCTKEGSASGFFMGPSDDLRNVFGAVSKAYYVPEEEVKKLDQRAIDDLFPRIPLDWFRGRDRALAQRGAWQETQAYQNAMQALDGGARGTNEMDTAQSGYGSQLIGAQYVADLWGAARQESRVFSLIDTFEMTAPTAYLPVEVNFPEMLYVSETATDLPYANLYSFSKTGSQRVQATAKKFIINQLWSGEMEEDSIIPFIPFIRRQAQLALGYYADSLAINGDTVTGATGNVNSDDGAPGATKHYLAADGIRKVGLVDNTANSKDLAGPISLAALNDVAGRMIDDTNKADWGHPNDPTDLVHLCDPVTADKIGVTDEMIVWKQYNKAPLLNGQIGDILGRPIISTIALPRTEADGKVNTASPSGTLFGQVATFNRRGLKAGWRRRIKMETMRIIGTDQTHMIYSLRLALARFTPTGAASGQEWADVIYDIT